VVVLGLTSLFTDVASEMVLPLLPLLMASVGGGAAMLGLMEGAADAANALIKYWSGALSDRMRRKPLVVAGYLLAALMRPLNAWAGSGLQIVLVRSLDRVGKGIRGAPRDALLADSVPPAERAAAFGFHRAMDHAGAVIGPLIAVLVLWGGAERVSVATVVALSLIPGLLGVLVLSLGVTEPPHVPATRGAAPVAGSLPPGAALLLMMTTLFAAFRIQEVMFLAQLLGMGVDRLVLPLAWSAMHVVKSATATPMGRLADRLGRERTLVAGYLTYSVTVVLAGASGTPWLLMGAMALYALHHGLTEGVEKALLSTTWPAARRGAGFGVYHGLTALVALPAGYAQGLILEQRGSFALGCWLGAGGLCCALLALRFARSSVRPSGAL